MVEFSTVLSFLERAVLLHVGDDKIPAENATDLGFGSLGCLAFRSEFKVCVGLRI